MTDSITLAQLEAKAQAAFTILDDYKTMLCGLDKPDLVQMTRDVLGTRKYTSRTLNHLMIGHLMTAKRRDLGYEDMLDEIDALKSRISSTSEPIYEDGTKLLDRVEEVARA